MATQPWPSELPNALLANSVKIESGTLSSDLDSGRFRQRKQFTVLPLMVNVEFVATQAEVEILDAWHEQRISNGADPFTIELSVNRAAPRTYTAQLVGGNYSYSHASDHRKISMSLYIEDRQSLTEAELESAIGPVVEINLDLITGENEELITGENLNLI